MANEIIRPTELPVRTDPVASEVTVSDNGSTVAGVSWTDGVNAAVPPASQSESEAGVINSKRMTPLTTKQAIDAQVPPKIAAAINNLNLGTMSQEAASDYTPTSGLATVALSNDYDDLDNKPALGTAAATDASDYATAAQGALADSAVQPSDPALIPPGGSTSQVLIKSSSTDYDTEWATSASATAVSYAPQVLTDGQQLQAQSNLSLANFKTVQILLDDTSMSYASDPGKVQVGSGDVIEAGGFRYEVAASDAADAHVETAGGVKLKVLGNVVRPDMFGAPRDGTSDDGDAWERAIATGAPILEIPSGVWKLNRKIICDRSIEIRCEPGAIIDCSGGEYGIRVQGALTQIANLAGDVAKDQQTITLESAPSLSPGELVVIWNPTNNSFFAAPGRNYRAGEILCPIRTDGAVITISGLTKDAYVASAVNVYKLANVQCTVRGGYWIEGGSVAPVEASRCTRVLIDRVGGLAETYGVVDVRMSYDVTINAPNALLTNDQITGSNYAVCIVSCQVVRYWGGVTSSTRHSVMLGYTSDVGSPPLRDVKIFGATIENFDNTVGAADGRGCCDGIEYVNCDIRSLANMGGMNFSYTGCRIWAHPDDAMGECIRGTEVAGGLYKITDCTLYSEGTWGSSTIYGGLIFLHLANAMREDLLVKVTNLTVISKGGGGAYAAIVNVRQTNASGKKATVIVDGVDGSCAELRAVLFPMKTDAGNYASDGLCVDNVRLICPAGDKYLIAPVSTGISPISGVPTREMQQSGAVTHVTTATRVQNPGKQSYPWKYSTAPVNIVSYQGASLSTGLLAGQVQTATILEEDGGGVTPGAVAASGDSTAGATIRFRWQASINNL